MSSYALMRESTRSPAQSAIDCISDFISDCIVAAFVEQFTEISSRLVWVVSKIIMNSKLGDQHVKSIGKRKLDIVGKLICFTPELCKLCSFYLQNTNSVLFLNTKLCTYKFEQFVHFYLVQF